EREPGEDAGGHRLLVLREGLPRRDVVGDGDLLRQPEVAGETPPDLIVDLVGYAVPVDRRHTVDERGLDPGGGAVGSRSVELGGHRISSWWRVRVGAAGLRACTRRSPRPRCPRARADARGCSTGS